MASSLTSLGRYALLLLFLQALSAPCEAQNAFFRFVRGQVSVVSPEGEVEKADMESVALEGELVRVGTGGLAILELEDRSTLKIEEGSELKLEALVKEEKDEDFEGTSDLVLKAGSVFVEVVQKFAGRPSLNLKNEKNVSLGVRGTEFFAGVDGDSGDFFTSVKSGEVEVYDITANDSEPVKAGDSMVIEEGRRITRPGRFDWASRLNWEGTESSASHFKSWRQEARQEYMARAKALRDRPKRPVLERFRAWNSQKHEKRRAVEKVKRLLDRRAWRETPSQLKVKRQQRIELRQLRRSGRRPREEGNKDQIRPNQMNGGGRGQGRNEGKREARREERKEARLRKTRGRARKKTLSEEENQDGKNDGRPTTRKHDSTSKGSRPRQNAPFQ